MQGKKFNRIIALLAAFAVLFVMLFSTAFLSEHIHHNCSGDNCSVCAMLEQCSNNIRSIGSLIIMVAFSIALCISMHKNVQYDDAVAFSCSLVSQKVRLND